jgi:hypothetical protein
MPLNIKKLLGAYRRELARTGANLARNRREENVNVYKILLEFSSARRLHLCKRLYFL